MYILWSLDAHQKRLKIAKNQAKTVRLDKMSRRDEVRQDKKFTFGHNVQTERDEFDASIVRMIYEINKIGVNINQIAKKYNEHQYVEPSADLLDKLDEVYAMMKSTIRIMKGGKDVTDY